MVRVEQDIFLLLANNYLVLIKIKYKLFYLAWKYDTYFVQCFPKLFT